MTNESPGNALVIATQAIIAPEYQKQLASMLPREVPVDRFTTVVVTALQRNPELLQADRQSLYNSCVALASRGLLPDGKQAALVVFNTNVAARGKTPQWVKKVQDMAMVEGIIAELGKAGVPAYAVSVYENDKITIWNDDDGQHVKHDPVTFGDRGKRVGAFAAGKMPNGRTYVEAMNMEELERTALRSKQSREVNNQKVRGGTWVSDPERMEQKSCMHRLRRRVPLTVPLPDDTESEITLDGEEIPVQPGAASGAAETDPGAGVRQEGDAGTNTNGAGNTGGGRRRPRALANVIAQTQQKQPEAAKEPEPPEEVVSDEPQEGDII